MSVSCYKDASLSTQHKNYSSSRTVKKPQVSHDENNSLRGDSVLLTNTAGADLIHFTSLAISGENLSGLLVVYSIL